MSASTTSTVRTIFSADASGFFATTAKMQARMTHFSRVATIGTQKYNQEWQKVTAGFVAGGALLAGGLIASGAAAVRWQSDFAGVAKTVGGTTQELGALEGNLRGLARTMATSHSEIAKTAEEAGALGVASKDIARFTRTMIMLGESTNLSSEEAATSIAQLMTIMKTAPGEVDKLGAVIVRLGNNGASTETQIVQMAQRIAGSARAVGISVQDVLGFSSAIASTGINIEAGGTAISKVFTKLDRIVTSGGPKLEAITNLMGDQWPQAFRKDAAGATQEFIEKLGQLQESGGSITKTLDAMGIKGIYETDVLRRLAGAGSLLGDQLGMANDEMGKGTALLKEYQVRNSTAAARISIAWNNIKDSAIDAGSSMLPMLARGADQIASFAHSWQNLPAPVRSATVGLTAAAAAGLLIVGGGMKAISVISDMASAYKRLADISPKTAAGLKKAAIAAIAITVATAALKAFTAAYDEAVAAARTKSSDIAVAMVEGFSAGGKQVDFGAIFGKEEKNVFTKEAFSAADALKRAFTPQLGDQIADAVWGTLGIGTSGSRIKESVKEVDKAFASLVGSGNADAAFEGYRQFVDFVAKSGVPIESVRPYLTDFRQQLELTAEGLNLGGQISEGEFVDWMGGKIPDAVQKATGAGGEFVANLTDQQKALAGIKSDADAARTALQKLAQQEAAAAGSELAVNAGQRDVMASIKKRGKSTSTTSKKGQANWQDYLGQAANVQAYISALNEAGADEEKLASVHDDMVKQLTKVGVAMGMTGEEARAMAELYAAVPGDVQTNFEAPGAVVTKQQAKDIANAVKEIPEAKSVDILVPSARPSKKEVDDFIGTLGDIPKEKKAAIRTIAELGGVEAARAALAGLKPKTVVITPKLAKSTLNVNVVYHMKGGPKFTTANGGFFNTDHTGMVQKFKDGGFAQPIGAQPPQIRAYSGAAGINWSELGSGPWEAFISGHPGKRDHSIDIWEKVGRRLGVFADGGMIDFSTIRAQSGGRGAGNVLNLNTINNYPQAEPTSVTHNRALQGAAVLGRFT